jgi:hypothetical protein
MKNHADPGGLRVALALLAAAALAGCEGDSSVDSGFGGNAGAQVQADLGGSYAGDFDKGRAVDEIYIPGSTATATNGAIRAFAIRQSGAAIQVTDNLGATYAGSVSLPGSVARPGGDYAAGAVIFAAPAEFSGYSIANAHTIEFSGTIQAVALAEISGQAGTTTNSGNPSINGQTTYLLTAANCQYQLSGTWQVTGANVPAADVQAHAPGSLGSVTVSPVYVPGPSTNTVN